VSHNSQGSAERCLRYVGIFNDYFITLALGATTAEKGKQWSGVSPSVHPSVPYFSYINVIINR